MTAVSPSSSGTPAATSAPKARIRMISVIGSERNSAFLKSSENDFESALLALAPPNCADEDVRVGGLDLRHRRDDRIDALARLVIVAADLELDEHRAAVLGDLALVALGVGRLDLGDALLARDAGDDVVDRLAHGRVGRLAALGGLDEDGLVLLLGEVVVDQAVGLARLPDVVVLVGRLLDAEGAADDERDRDERQPAPDRLLAVLGAPAARTRSESVRVHDQQCRSVCAVTPSGPLASWEWG